MGIIKKIKNIFRTQPENQLETVITLPDQQNTTLAQLIYTAGMYKESSKNNELLKKENEELRTENTILKQKINKHAENNKPTMNNTEEQVLDLIKKTKITKKNFVKEITENTDINSKPSAYRIINQLKKKGLIKLEKTTYTIN